MNRFIALILLAAGVAFLASGLNAANSFAYDAHPVFTGAPTDRATWLTVLGTIGVLAGGLGLFVRRRN